MRNQETGTMYLKVLNKKLETDTMVLYYTVIEINMKLDAESSDPNDITKLYAQFYTN